MIALKQDLVAATDTHHSVAKVVYAGRLVSGAKQPEHGERHHNKLGAAFQKHICHSSKCKRRGISVFAARTENPDPSLRSR
jgi:hypothetical protein